MLNNVTIGDKHMYDDFGLVMASRVIGMPAPQTKTILVPMRDGKIDLTEELSGVVKYDNRTITMKFKYLGDAPQVMLMNLKAYLHGKRMNIIFDDDSNFYYNGRITLSSDTITGAEIITLTCDCDPWKYDITPSDVDWEWDVFDFEEGIINEAGEIVVDGTTSFTLICREKREFPIFTVSDNMSMNCRGKSYNLYEGENKIYNLFLQEGENEMSFTGTGTVGIHYIGGSL